MRYSGNGVSNSFNHSRRDVTGPYVINYQMNGSDSNCSSGPGERGLLQTCVVRKGRTGAGGRKDWICVAS